MASAPTLARGSFGALPNGAPVDLFTLSSASGIEVRAISHGATIVSIRTPDNRGRSADIVLGFDRIDDYLHRSPYFGAVVGRYANRIARGRFTLDGRVHQLTVNDGGNHLHGGLVGFDKVLWNPSPFEREDRAGIVFSYVSPDGEEGYPGTLTATVSYALTGRDELVVDYAAVCDHPTIVNLTQHSYFNLAGEGSGDVLAHAVTIAADRFTPVDAAMIPDGELAVVDGTPFDFRTPTPIGARIDDNHPQLAQAGGYDHNFVLRPGVGPAVLVEEPASGRTLRVDTTEPGLQFYTGNKLSGQTGKNGRRYARRAGFCLETQHFPDSPNHPAFPSTTLRPGETFRSTTVFTFGIRP
jgi:aldose 1-epimerase